METARLSESELQRDKERLRRESDERAEAIERAGRRMKYKGRTSVKKLDLPPDILAAYNSLRSKGYSKNRALAELIKPATAQ